jgi:hypothetical protein
MSEQNVHEDIINGDNPITEQEFEASNEAGVQVDESLSGTVDIPDRYQGKSVEDIILMHQNAEKELSRQGNELGENRKLVDKLLQTEKYSPSPVQEEALDWDYEPEKAAAKLVEQEVGAIKQELSQYKQARAIEKFKSQYPTFESDTASTEFMEWVNSSQYRTNLYQKNYNGIDLDAATELMQGWQENKPAPVNEEKRQKDLKAAAMEKGASSGGSRKKMWSRAYIRDLRIKEPMKYKQHYDEIMAAYDDGRVTK